MVEPKKNFRVKLTFTESILGTVPKDPEVYAAYIATKAPENADTNDEVETVEEVEEKGWTGFHSDEGGCFLYDYQIKGFFKEAANSLREPLGITALRANTEQCLFIQPRKIYLGPEPEGVVERPLRAMTPKGPRVTVVRSDYFPAGTEVEFDVLLFKNKKITEKMFRHILDWGTLKGVGQFRNGGYGRFTYEARAQPGQAWQSKGFA